MNPNPIWLVSLLLLSCFSRVRLCATPETAAHQASPSLGFSRQEWAAISLSKDICKVSLQIGPNLNTETDMDTGEHHRKRERKKTASHKPRNARGNYKPGEIWKRSFPSTLKGRIALLKLDFRLSASKTMKQYISIALNHPVCGCYCILLAYITLLSLVNRGKVIQKNSSK